LHALGGRSAGTQAQHQRRKQHGQRQQRCPEATFSLCTEGEPHPSSRASAN